MNLMREELIKESKEMMEIIYDKFKNLGNIYLNSLEPSKTMLIIIDMNNGFAKKGSLYSSRIENIIKPIEHITKEALRRGIQTIAFTDYHTKESIELESYPEHCMYDTEEWKLVDELNIEGIKLIKKNSTNGFIEPDFNIDEDIENLIVVGDCTDICIYQFVISAKANLNRINRKIKIYVPMTLVETYDLPTHKANFMNFIFLNSLMDNGIEVVENIIL